MRKLTISMAIFNSYFDITRGRLLEGLPGSGSCGIFQKGFEKCMSSRRELLGMVYLRDAIHILVIQPSYRKSPWFIGRSSNQMGHGMPWFPYNFHIVTVWLEKGKLYKPMATYGISNLRHKPPNCFPARVFSSKFLSRFWNSSVASRGRKPARFSTEAKYAKTPGVI